MDKFKLEEFELAPDVPGIKLETDNFSIVVAPELGGKIISLVNKATGREFLSRTNIPHRMRTYADRFENYERDGADECFPTVEDCPYPAFPWEGVPVPDHGEVWTLPWQYEVKQGRLQMWVKGVRLPYVFQRDLRFETLARGEKPYIRFSYTVRNESPFEMPFVYAFHPLFKVETRARILMPSGTDVVSYMSTEDRLGPPMTRHTWPKVTDVTLDKAYNRSSIRSSRTKEAEKIFSTRLEQGRCALVYPNGEFIGFLFPAKKLPHLGLWINEGGWNNLHHAALEPSTSQVDRLDTAWGLKACGVVPANGQYEWDISLILGEGEERQKLLGEF